MKILFPIFWALVVLGLIEVSNAATTRFDSVIANGSLSVGDTAAANSKAIVDLKSTTKGMLPPRMTTAQRDAITSPPTGLTLFNTDTNKLNAYNGTSWTEVGGGAGGLYAGGQNLITNNSWETDTTGWTASGGSYARTTTAAHIVPPGVGAASWDASASAQTLSATSVTVTANDGLSGRNGVLSCAVKTAATDLKLQVYDGSNVISANSATDVVTSSSAGFVRSSWNFIFPSSGTLTARFYAQSDSAIAYIDDCFFGLAEGFNVLEVSQATLIGQAYIDGAGSCQWSRTNTSMGAFTSDADCGTVVVEQNPGPGTISATDTDLPKFTVSNLPPGTYQVTVGVSSAWCAATAGCAIAINDGTTTSGNLGFGTNGESFEVLPATLRGVFVYTSVGSRTFEIYGQASTSTVNINPAYSGQRLTFSIYRFPTTAETAYRPEQVSWYVDATMDGANPSLGTADVSSFTEITHASLTLTPQSGSQAVGVMCSSTNAATAPSSSATTCAAGSESVGINFNIPKAGAYQVCWYGTHYSDVNNTGIVNGTLELIETPTNAQTLTLEGGTRINFGLSGPTVASSAITGNLPIANCSIFNWSSAGTKGVRLMYEQDVTATVNYSLIIADAAAASGQRNMRWTVTPVAQSMPMPILVGGVTSNSTGAERVERLLFGGTASGGEPATTCAASPCVVAAQSGSWVSSVTRTSTGIYPVTIAAGIFSAPPACTCTAGWSGVGSGGICAATGDSATAITVSTYANNGSGVQDNAVSVICMGPR